MPTYLLKNRHGNYYTRITFPHPLRQAGCPAEARVSLRTKDYAVAGMRNLLVAHGLKSMTCRLAQQMGQSLPAAIRAMLDTELLALRRQLEQSELVAHTLIDPSAEHIHLERERLIPAATTPVDAVLPSPTMTLSTLQTAFVERKQQDGISLRSLDQLQQRALALVEMMGADFAVAALKYRHIDAFMLHLTQKGLKEKTLREYKAACSQMLGFAVKMEYIGQNPFNDIKVKRSQPTPRQRWERPQLKQLFSSPTFTQHAYHNSDDFWLPLVLLYTGARPAEICQLQVGDVVTEDAIPCFDITDEGEFQTVKNDHSKRRVPMHSTLIALGFLTYVEQRRKQRQTQLFNCKAVGEFGEWTKGFEGRFSRTLSKLGFAAGQRPTAYGFRHAVIDELQRLDTPEHVVADLVGHSKQGFTYRHYGKQTPVQRLQQVIELLDFSDEVAWVAGFAVVN